MPQKTIKSMESLRIFQRKILDDYNFKEKVKEFSPEQKIKNRIRFFILYLRNTSESIKKFGI